MVTCTSPFLWKAPGSPSAPRWVPCGQCLSCRIRRAAEWRVRLLGELEYSERAGFCTWTYGVAPSSGSLVKSDLQEGLKRLRERLRPRCLRYYACGEYGERNGRPHYHGIVFGLDVRDRNLVAEAWGLGRTSVGTVTADSILYVVDYTSKAVLGKGAADEYEATGRERPFALCSKGLGARWCDAHADALREHGVMVDGVPVGLPRYFARRVGLARGGSELEPRVKHRMEADARAELVTEVHESRVKRGEYVDALESLWASRGQRDRTLQARRVLRKKGEL